MVTRAKIKEYKKNERNVKFMQFDILLYILIYNVFFFSNRKINICELNEKDLLQTLVFTPSIGFFFCNFIAKFYLFTLFIKKNQKVYYKM